MRSKCTVFLVFSSMLVFHISIAQNINTIIGGGLFNNGPATASEFNYPCSVTVDKAGNIYIADELNHIIRKVDAAGSITTYAGQLGNISYTGDGGPAIAAAIGYPTGVAVDTSGNLFIADNTNRVIRKVNTAGIISTYAGSGHSLSDGIQATAAALTPYGIAVDQSGNLYIANNGSSTIRRVSTSGIITTIAGNGTAGLSGDGFAATNAELNQPTGVCVDKTGNVFIAEANNFRIRKVDASGIITTYAGQGTPGDSGDNGPATAAYFYKPVGVGTDTSGNVYVVDNGNNNVRKISTTGTITRAAGGLIYGGFTGDGGPATTGQLYLPTGVAADRNGNLFIADAGNSRVRKVSPAVIITTIAGCGLTTSRGYKGDGGPAKAAYLYSPSALAYDTAHNLLIADMGNNCVRKVNSAGIISTIAGNDTAGYSGDSGLAIQASLYNPLSIATDKKNNVYIADQGNNRIRKVDNAGIITTYAGTGVYGFSGDGHRADSAKLSYATGVACDRRGNLYFCDYNNYRVRKIDTNQIITTIAGTGVAAYYGDGGPASAAQISPYAIFVDTTGNIFITDQHNFRIRKIDTMGIITTVAGNGSNSISGDGTSAVFAGIGAPNYACTDKTGNLYITGAVIRRVDLSGIITTFAGETIVGGFSGDGGPAILAEMAPYGLIFDTSGNLLVADEGSNRIREIYNASINISTPHDTVCAGAGATFTAIVKAAPEYSPYYHWQKNGIIVGTNSSTYSASILDSGDVIVCSITDGLTGPSIATSNQITIVVPSGVPLISISSNVGTSVCLGTVATCTGAMTDGGLSPTLDWYKNGVKVYTGSSYVFTPANNDTVRCKLISSLPCLTNDTATSNNIVFTTFFNVPSVTISLNPGSAVCQGTSVTMRANSINGGYPPIYDWYKNGTHVFNGNPYIDTPVNGDIVYCKLTSSASCVIPDTAVSATTVFTVNPPANPSVTISVSPGDTICPGSSVSFTATAVLGGASPIFSWFLNGSNLFTGNPYKLSPANGDRVYCELTSNDNCILTDTATSTTTTLVYTIPLADSVTISISPGDTVCSGATVTTTATSINGGTSPTYDWYVNNHKRYTGAVYSFVPNNGDVVYCNLTSSACVQSNPAASSNITVVTSQSVSPSVSISIDPGTTLCAGVGVVCTATSTNGGSAPVYTWYQNGVDVFTGTSFSFIPTAGDKIYCQITSNEECASPLSVSSGEASFQTDSIPRVIISCDPGQVNFRGTTVTFSAGITGYAGNIQYQWMINGKPIAGATNGSYSGNDFSTWDSIKCQVTFSGACNGTTMSNTLAIDTYHGMKLYPDPNHGDFVVNGNNYDANGDPVKIRIYNSTGKLVYEKDAAFDAITFYTEINLGRQLPPGVYTLRLTYSLDNLSMFFVVKD